jgi:predicted small secreted protein
MTRLRILLAVLAAATLMAGCAGDSGGGEDVATAGGTASASAEADDEQSGDTAEQMRRFASCMRENGIDMPDPETDGEGRVLMRGPGDGEGGASPDREKFQAAQQKCKQYLPNGGEPPKMNPEDVEKARQFAKCMRENGVPNFPDPQPDGGMRIEAGPDSGIDPQSQEFKDAHAKCEQYMPRRRSTGGNS